MQQRRHRHNRPLKKCRYCGEPILIGEAVPATESLRDKDAVRRVWVHSGCLSAFEHQERVREFIPDYQSPRPNAAG